MRAFSFAIKHTLDAEGGARFANHSADRGGRTRWGISEGLARAHGYEGDMRELPRAFAVRVAELEFWGPLRLDEIDSKYIAAEIFDTAFNGGPVIAVRLLQDVLGWFGVPVRVDGRMGPNTIGAVNSLLPAKEKHLYAALNLRQGMRYVRIIEADRSQAVFFAGGMKRLSRFPEMVAA